MNSADKKAIGWLVLLVLATSLPFVHRAYFVDDYYHVTMARGLLEHPARPYDFVADDEGPGNKGWERGQRPRMVNPPLFHYYLAGVMKLWGDAVWKLRTACLIFPLISVLAAYFLGKRFVNRPLAAAALLAVTPAFWLTSYSLLIDSAQLAFFLAALLAFIEGQERKSVSWILISGALMGATLLTKYFGVLIIPLAVFWQMIDPDRRRWWPGYAALAVTGAMLLFWGVWGILTYGQMHLVASLPRGFHGGTSILAYLGKTVILAGFLGGSCLFLLFGFGLLAFQSRKLAALIALLCIACFALLVSPRGGFLAGQAGLFVVLAGSTAAFLLLLGHASYRSSEKGMFLSFWIWLGLLELIVIMPWTAGRYLLLVLPALVWIFQSMTEENGRRWMWPAAGIATALVGGTLAVVDYAQANVIVKMAAAMEQQQTKFNNQEKYYLGDTFTGYAPYLGPLGWRAAFPSTALKAGDLLLVPRYRTSSWWALPHPEHLHLLASYEFPNRIPVRLMDIPASAGFYASCWGALPFAITNDPLERFDLFQIQ